MNEFRIIFATSSFTGIIDNLIKFLQVINGQSFKNKINFNSGKLKILFDLNIYKKYTQSHLGFIN